MELHETAFDEARKVYETYWNSYFAGNITDFASTLDEHFQLIGTTEKEIGHTKTEGVDLLFAQIPEVVGNVEKRNRQLKFSALGSMVLASEFCDVYVRNGEDWHFYSKLRLSTILQNSAQGWKVVQQHGSIPDQHVEGEETIALDKINRENIELRDAVRRRTIELEHKNRELEIEAALEKVLAVAMSMITPEDMLTVCRVISDELQRLGVTNIRNVQTAIIDEEKGTYLNYQYFTPYEKECIEITDFRKNPLVRDMVRKMLESPKGILTGNTTGKELEEFREYRKKEGQFPDPLMDETDSVDYHFLSIGPGGLGLTLYKPLNEEGLQLFKRFHRVFTLAYRRFRDIEKAGEQARQARIELSLERIRAQVTAMRESAELLDIVVTMRSEFVALGHEAHYFWHMRWLPDVYKKAMTSGDGTRIGMVMTLPRHIHGDNPLLDAWEKSDEPTVVFAMDTDTAVDYVDKMITLGDFEQVDPNAPTLDDIRHIGGLTFIMARTTHGEIGFSLPGPVPDPPSDAIDTLVRFASVFDLAYKRFEDLKAAERQALLIREERDRLEIALNELHATQSQLIQQEKLASLGQLTAGIAHEIKNPLNFVNNFSEVSLEMMEELMEIASLSSHQVIFDLLDDIRANLQKIHQHGTRANSIVSSMLQHSRGGSGKMEPTNVNALVKEYANLAFHGMRAGKNPINVDIRLDLDETLGNVDLIAEDFSRVVVNLCNNAFDAMRELTRSEPGYGALLSLRTKWKGDSWIMSVEDNGTGIPEDMKNKILQPFFTTKKGTEGTGLGLSITHDIIKAHGGNLGIESRPGLTIFTIKIPVNENR